MSAAGDSSNNGSLVGIAHRRSSNEVMLQTPPGFIARTELRQAAWDNGYRVAHENDGAWLSYASTTAHGQLWLAAEGDRGPWWVAIEHPGVLADLGPGDAIASPGSAAYRLADKPALYDRLDGIYRLGVSLPDAPLQEFEHAVAGLPRTTEVERLTIQRIGQDVFRRALLAFWNGACAVTGITDEALLRASHIVPWSKCENDAQRLDVNNGLLLSALWDAAFDARLIGFDAGGSVVVDASLSEAARSALGSQTCLRREPTAAQKLYLQTHLASTDDLVSSSRKIAAPVGPP